MSTAMPPGQDPQQPFPAGQQPPPYPGFGSQPGHDPAGAWGGQQPAYPGGVVQGYPGYPDAPGDRRPGSVVAAAVITIVMSALTGLMWIGSGVLLLAAGDSAVDQVRGRADVRDALNEAGWTFEQLRTAMDTIGAVGLVGGILMLLAIIPAIGVLRRSRAARVILVVLAAITALVGLLFTVTGFAPALIWVIAGVAVIVLLYVGGASAWFAGRSSGRSSIPTW